MEAKLRLVRRLEARCRESKPIDMSKLRGLAAKTKTFAFRYLDELDNWAIHQSVEVRYFSPNSTRARRIVNRPFEPSFL